MWKRLGRLFGRQSDAVVSFPKSGRTWLRVMLDDLSVDVRFSHAGAHHSPRSCHFEKLDLSAAEKFDRIIFLHRDPRDTVVSNFHWVDRRRGGYAGGLSDFIRDPHHGIEKIVRFNAMWLELAMRRDEMLTITYEDMHSDTVAVLARIVEFLEVPVDPLILPAVVAKNTFDQMRERERDGSYAERYGNRLTVPDTTDLDCFKVRRGRVGGYKDYLDAADLEYCSRYIETSPYS